MNKIPVYLCIAILLGQVVLFSGEQNAFDASSDSEFDSEKPFMTEGRYDPEEAVWQIETIDQSSSSSYGEYMGKYNRIQVDSYGTPHLTYLSPTANAMNINYTFFNGQAWNTDTITQSGGSPCFDLDSSDIPRVGIFTYYSSNTADLRLATPPAQSSSPWSLEMIDNSSANVGSNCDMVIGQDGDIYMIYWEYHSNNSALHFAHHNGTSWTKSVLDNDGGAFSSLEIDDDGNLHVVYQDLTNGGLKYGINEGQGWALSSLDASASGRGNSLDFDSDNNPHVSYFDMSNNSVKYAHLVNSGWSISTVKSGLSWTDNSTYYSETSIAIDSFDDVHISYYDSGLQHAFHGDNSWEFKEIDSVVNIMGTLEIVIDDNDKIHISYHDKDNQSLKYATSEEPQGGEGITDPSDATVWFDNEGYASYSPDEISITFEIYTDCECSLKAWAYLDVYLNGTKIDSPFGTAYTVSNNSSISKTVVWTASNTGTYDFYLSLIHI